MIERIRRLTNLQEAILVIVIGLGVFIYSSISGLLMLSTRSPKTWTYFFNEYGSLTIVVIEVITLAIIALILNKRGWKLEHLNLKISFTIILRSILLLFLTLFTTGLVYRLMTYSGTADNDAIESIKYVYHKNYLIWGLVLIINSLFEEVPLRRLLIQEISKWQSRIIHHLEFDIEDNHSSIKESTQ